MKINTKRLALLAYYLPSIPVNQFDLTGWIRCAMGWATKVPEFAELGFTYVFNGAADVPYYKDETSWYAVEKFFGLTNHEAETLFSMFCYTTGGRTTPKQVAARIKQFLKGKRDF